MFRLDKLTQKAQDALQQCQVLAEKNGSQIMYPVHLLIALAEEKEGIVRGVLEKCGVHPDAIVAEARRLLLCLAKERNEPAGQLLERAGATHDAILKALVSVRGTQRITDQNPETKYQALERYAHDLTESARQGKLAPVIGRD